MELEYRWSEFMYFANLTCRPVDSRVDRWDGVATLYKRTTVQPWRVTFTWKFDYILPSTAYIYRQKWDDVDKAKRAVERKARGLIGVLQVQGRWS